ncbi:MAG: pyridoxal phosphate-dependent aminotransferase [Clostridiaceae bacterium]
MQSLSNRLEFFSESVIRKMTRIADKYGAINLSQGFPDFDPPEELIEALKQAAVDGPHQYEITWGSKEFRDKLARKQEKFMGVEINPEENIVVTCGSTEAMMAAMMSVCNPGDKVIVFSPFYENYSADTILAGAEPIFVPLIPPEFNYDKKYLRKAFEQNPKALILCNPSNPTGKVFTREELLYISELAEEFDTYVITDEVYEHIVFKPNEHIYFASLPGMFERTISCSSLSKTYSITGWRLGYIIASKDVIENCKKVHDFLTVGAAAPLQKAAVAGLELPDEYYESLSRTYERKRELFLNGLDEIGLKYFKPQGAYYVLVDISEFKEKDDYKFCEWLAKEIGVAAVQGSSFFREEVHNYIRLHFAKKDETLIKALNKLKKLKLYIN